MHIHHIQRTILFLALIGFVLLPALGDQAEEHLVMAPAGQAGEALLKQSGAVLMARLGNHLLLRMDTPVLQAVEKRISCQRIAAYTPSRSLYLVMLPPGREKLPQDVLFQLDKRTALVDLAPSQAEALAQKGLEIRRITAGNKPFLPAAQPLSVEVAYDPRVQDLLDQVTEDRLFDLVADLSGEQEVQINGQPYTILTRNSRYVDEIEQATLFAYEFFSALNYDVVFHNFPGAGGRNVIATKPGTLYPDQYIILCGHMDDMPQAARAPGADDNASGSVAVMLAAELFQDLQFEKSIIFALWTGEEQGLIGSGYYAQDAYQADMDIHAVLNLDMIAYDNSGGPVLELHASQNGVPGSMDIAQAMTDVITVYDLDLDPETKPYGITASDHASFWDYGYAAILGIEDFQDFNPYYHTVQDDLDKINLPYFTEFTRASLGTTMHLAGVASRAGVHRFFNTRTGGHFFTISSIEQQYIQDNLPHYTYEGTKFFVHSPADQTPSSVPVYRFFNTRTGGHFFTISQAERDAVANLPNYSYEGVKFYVYTPGQPETGTVPVYRFFNTRTGGHFFTTSTVERQYIENNLPHFQYEGAKFYVYPL